MPHKASNEDDPGDTGYLSLARTITLREGVLALIAVGLVAFLCVIFWGRFPRIEANQDKILAAQASANISMTAFSAEHRQIEIERTAILSAQVRLLQLLCIGAAKDDMGRRECSLALPERRQ